MIKEISLNGIWKLIGEDENGSKIQTDITIPGYVHPALEKAGLIPPMYWRDNAEKCQWIEEKEWTFVKEFTLDDSSFKDTYLSFGGVDVFADIYLNDTLLYQSENMFVPFEIPSDNYLKTGTNTIKVVIKPYKEIIGERPQRPGAFFKDRMYVRRIQCTFYWDWVNRFVSAGIWRDITLKFMPEAHIEDVFAQTSYIADTSAGVRIRLTTKNAVQNDCTFRISVKSPSGEEVWNEHGRVFLNTINLDMCIENPLLWWPNGYGEHPLYTIDVELFDKENNLLHTKSLKTGIRTVFVEKLKDKPGSREEAATIALRNRKGTTEEYDHPGESYIFLVNGKRIFSKGGNWVPPNPFPGTTTDEEYRTLVKLMEDSHINCMRVWGGGVYEPDVFYDLCDEMGIMITQDFMLACGDYPEEDESFKKSFYDEVYSAVLRLRNHPSIVCWIGNNENTDGYDWDDPNMRDMALWPDVYMPILDQLDPMRPFIPGSPYGGKGNGDLTIGDNHSSHWWAGAEKISPDVFDKVGRFTSESSLGGYVMPSSLKKFLEEKDFLDLDSEITEYHIKNNPFFTNVLKWPSIIKRLQKNTDIIVGLTDDSWQNIYRLCYIQYEWVRFVVEGMRRNKWYSSGVQYWMYNDCWPALGFSIIDFYLKPKAGWYASKHFFAPISSSVREDKGILNFICLNDSFDTSALHYSIKAFNCDTNEIKEVACGDFTLKSNENNCVSTLSTDEINLCDNMIVYFDISKDGCLITRSRWYKGWLNDLNIKKAKIHTEFNPKDNTVTVKCTEGVAIGVCFDGEFSAKDGFFDLMEGETKTVSLETKEAIDNIKTYGYNVDITDTLN